MGATSVIEWASREGVRLYYDIRKGRLRYRSKVKPSNALLADIRRHKRGVIKELRRALPPGFPGRIDEAIKECVGHGWSVVDGVPEGREKETADLICGVFENLGLSFRAWGHEGRVFLFAETFESEDPLKKKKLHPPGLKWCLEHKTELLAAGWTLPELFARKRTARIVKPGVAYLSVWGCPGLEVCLSESGALSFLFAERGGRKIKQISRPAICK